MYSAGLQAENLTMLYRPLFWTSYWCEDWLHSTGCYSPAGTGTLSVLIASASSKTAFSLAYLVRKRIRSGELKNATIVGLTSPRNVAFTQRLGLYDEVYEYGSFRHGKAFQGDSARQWLYVDVAGNDALNAQVREHFASPRVGRIVKNVALGVTNLQPTTHANDDMKWAHNEFDPAAPALAAPGVRWPAVEHFFMVEWLNLRKNQLSIPEITRRQREAWAGLMRDCPPWVELQPVHGAQAVREAYLRLVKEGLGPDKGLIWSLWGEKLAKL